MVIKVKNAGAIRINGKYTEIFGENEVDYGEGIRQRTCLSDSGFI